jgi:hypothetical protein
VNKSDLLEKAKPTHIDCIEPAKQSGFRIMSGLATKGIEAVPAPVETSSETDQGG